MSDYITGSYAYWHLTKEQKQAFHDQQGEHMQVPTPMTVAEHTLKARTKALERTIVQLDRTQAALRALVQSAVPYVLDVEQEEDDPHEVMRVFLVPEATLESAKNALAPEYSAE